MSAACFDETLAERLVIGPLEPSLREALLSHAETCDRCLDLLSAATGRLISRGPDDDSSPRQGEAQLGGVFAGRYVILDVLGRGGMGVVYLAHDTVLGREVALKVMRERSERSVAMLRDEARALGAITHPNVVTVYDLATDGEHLGLAMERVHGMTLRERLQRTSPTRRARVRALMAMSEGIVAAHRAGVIHGDIKLDNALVDAANQVRVTDFGLANLVGRMNPVVGGTAGFRAPEVTAGVAADAASDQYSLATAWLDALTGERATSPSSWLAVARNVRPRWVRAPLTRALSEAPEARFPSVHDLLKRLKRRRAWFRTAVIAIVLSIVGGPWWVSSRQGAIELEACVQAALEGLPDRLPEGGSALGSTGAGAASVTSVWSRAAADYRTWRARVSQLHAVVCDAPSQHEPLSSCLEVERAWVEDDIAAVQRDNATSSLEGLVNISAIVDEDLCQDPIERDAIVAARAGARGRASSDGALVNALGLGAYAAPEELDQMVARLETQPPSRVLLNVLLFRSVANERMQSLDAAWADAERAFELATRMRRRSGISRAAVVLGSLAIQERADIRAARMWARLARSLNSEPSLPGYQMLVAELETTLAVASGRAQDIVAAVERLRAEPVAVLQIGPRLLAILGLAMVELGDHAAAAEQLHLALDGRLAVPDVDLSRVAGAMHNLAIASLALVDEFDAYLWIRDASALRAHLPSDHPDSLTLARTQARFASEVFGRHDEAYALAESVLTQTRRRFPSHHVDVLAAVGLAADLARGAGLRSRALELAQEGVRLVEEQDFGGAVAALPLLVLADVAQDPGDDPASLLAEALTRLGPVTAEAPMCLRVRALAMRIGAPAGTCTRG